MVRPYIIAVINLVIIGVGLIVNQYAPHINLGWIGRAPLVFCAVAPAIITFYWLLGVREIRDISFDSGLVRTAVAGAITVLYVVLIGIFVFWEPSVDASGKAIQPAEISNLLVSSFTNVVSVVIAFYFGASAYVQVRTQIQRGASGESNEKSPQSAASP
jgi:hypothetical protein